MLTSTLARKTSPVKREYVTFGFLSVSILGLFASPDSCASDFCLRGSDVGDLARCLAGRSTGEAARLGCGVEDAALPAGGGGEFRLLADADSDRRSSLVESSDLAGPELVSILEDDEAAAERAAAGGGGEPALAEDLSSTAWNWFSGIKLALLLMSTAEYDLEQEWNCQC
jgi:hypothetical protein